MADPDPRSSQDGLGWVTRAVFSDPRVRLRVGAARTDAAVRYAIVPSVRRARFLMPLASRRVRVATVRSYNGLRPPAVRAARATLGALIRAGAADVVRFPVLNVLVPAGVDPAEALLTDYLAARLGEPWLHAAIGVRPPDPHHKPTLQLFDAAGRPRGFAKLGWNDATRALVRAEASALRALAARAGTPGYPLVPTVRWAGDWGRDALTVLAPLPPETRRLPGDRPVRLADLLTVARDGGPAGPRRPLNTSSYAERLTARAARTGEPRLIAAVRALLAQAGDTTVELGYWHGDWVPWNLGIDGDRLVVWDWEHSAADVPVGLDLAHHAFQTALILDRSSAVGAAAAAAAALDRHGPVLGADGRCRRAILDMYLIELWLRVWSLAAGGAGWTAALHPALLDLLDSGQRLSRPA